MLQEADVDLIQHAARRLPRRRSAVKVIDLGAGSGTTLAAVLCARSENVVGVTYDIDEANLHWSQAVWKNLLPGWSNSARWEWRQVDSVEAAEEHDDGSVDFLLIDTSHEFEHTAKEIIVWEPKMRKNGWLWLHDYVGDYPGVTRAVDAAIANGMLIAERQEGLGILCRYTHG